MDIPIHVAAAACVCQATVAVEKKLCKHPPSKGYTLVLGAVYFSLSVASHLFLDMLPHYNFVYKILTLSSLPYLLRNSWTLFKHGLLILPVLILLLAFPRKKWLLIGVSLFGGAYPDLEKLMYLHFSLPRALVIFRGHSCSYSPPGWEVGYKWWLIGAEMALYVLFLLILSYPLCQKIQRQAKLEKGLFPLFHQAFAILSRSLKELFSDVWRGVQRLSGFHRIMERLVKGIAKS